MSSGHGYVSLRQHVKSVHLKNIFYAGINLEPDLTDLTSSIEGDSCPCETKSASERVSNADHGSEQREAVRGKSRSHDNGAKTTACKRSRDISDTDGIQMACQTLGGPDRNRERSKEKEASQMLPIGDSGRRLAARGVEGPS